MQATPNLEELAAFVAVVHARSFTRAAESLGTQKAHLSRVITRLEARHQVRLLQRSTRSLTATEAGRELFERARIILAAVDETRHVLERTRSEPQGLLRVTCGEEFGSLVVVRWVARLMQRHPQVRVQAELTNRVLDLVHEGIDVAVRVGSLADSSLAARRLGEIHYALYASPSYLRRRRSPRAVAELSSHDRIAFGTGAAGWRLVRGGEEALVQGEARFTANNHLAVRHCAAAGLGIALLPVFQARPLVSQGLLKPVLPGWGREPVPVHAVFSTSRYLAPKVRAFVDLACEDFDAALQLSNDAAGPGLAI